MIDDDGGGAPGLDALPLAPVLLFPLAFACALDRGLKIRTLTVPDTFDHVPAPGG